MLNPLGNKGADQGFSIAIQAGGNSLRMGKNKALSSFLGRPLIQRVQERLRGITDDLFVTTNDIEHLAFLGLPCYPDQVLHHGALGGLLTALASAHHPLVGVVACDMPFVNAGLLAWQRELLILEKGVDLVIPRSENGLEPLHAAYRRDTCLPAIRQALEAGLLRMDSWFPKVRMRVLQPSEYGHLDPRGMAFINVNTPEELAAAEALTST